MIKKQIFLGFLILGMAIITPLISYGAENDVIEVEETENLASEQVNEDVELDENITANDLDISGQNILPSNPFYFLKSGWRGFQSAFTFNPVKKAELKLRFADERLIEAKKMAESLDVERASQFVEKAIEKYEKETQRVKEHIENFKDIDKEKAEKFIERFTDHQIKQQKLIDRIENKLIEKGVAPEKIEAIIEHKERAMEHFANGVLKVVNPEVLKEKLEKAIEEGRGSQFKHFKNLEILKNLEERVPEEAREAIKKAQENAKKRLHNVLGESEETRERFKDFIEDTGGDRLHKFKVLEELDADNFDFNIKRVLNEARENTLDKVSNRIENIKDENIKEKFFKRLENINIKDLNIIDKLERRLPEEANERLRKAKEKAIENRNTIKERLENSVNMGTDAINNIKDRKLEIKDNIRARTDGVAIPGATRDGINDKGIFNQVEKRK
ncbi:MAG: DUF5667 domain-containing protein, partial [Patescibacteria group bacterium]